VARITGEARVDVTHELILLLLQRAAMTGPLLVVIEDAHWLDSASWAVLELMAARVEGLHTIVATRPVQDSSQPALHRLLAVLLKPYQPREGLAMSLGLADVHLVSLQPSMEGLVMPSKVYGVAAAGRPLVYIGDPGGEIAEIVSRHDIGLAVRAGDAEALAAALLELKADPRRRLAMGARARALFEAQYDKPIALERWGTALRAAR